MALENTIETAPSGAIRRCIFAIKANLLHSVQEGACFRLQLHKCEAPNLWNKSCVCVHIIRIHIYIYIYSVRCIPMLSRLNAETLLGRVQTSRHLAVVFAADTLQHVETCFWASSAAYLFSHNGLLMPDWNPRRPCYSKGPQKGLQLV